MHFEDARDPNPTCLKFIFPPFLKYSFIKFQLPPPNNKIQTNIKGKGGRIRVRDSHGCRKGKVRSCLFPSVLLPNRNIQIPFNLKFLPRRCCDFSKKKALTSSAPFIFCLCPVFQHSAFVSLLLITFLFLLFLEVPFQPCLHFFYPYHTNQAYFPN